MITVRIDEEALAFAVAVVFVIPTGVALLSLFVARLWARVGGPELLDRAYRSLWRLPACTPGRCCCRRTCFCITQEPSA